MVKDIICLIWGRNLFDSNNYLFGPKIFGLKQINFVSFKQNISLHQRKCFKHIILYAPGSGAESESASACEEWVKWTNVSAAWLWYVSFECERRTYRRSPSWKRLRANWCMESPGGHCKASAVCNQKQSKRSFPYGIPLGVLRRRVVSSPAHEEARLLWA